MSIEISREMESRLIDEARQQGISVDALLKRFIDERASSSYPAQSVPSLPIWHLGAIGTFHRRDICDDAC